MIASQLGVVFVQVEGFRPATRLWPFGIMHFLVNISVFSACLK